MLAGKNIVLGITGGIAAYKAAEIASRLMKMHAEVDVVMTSNATEFITPLTLQTITKRAVTVDMFEPVQEMNVKHISLAEKADLVLVAPATANILGKVANGIADDFLSTMIMATKAPVVFSPAMNTNMLESDAVCANIKILSDRGYKFIESDSGILACGVEGKGKLPEPNTIVDYVVGMLVNKELPLSGKTALITAGPTRENIDPVRYITNRSSGKMGYAIAESLKKQGADVVLVTGPSNELLPQGVEVIPVTSAQDMYEAVAANYDKADIVVFMAAVADYRCVKVAEQKMKKIDGSDEMTLNLTQNVDIAFEMGKLKDGQPNNKKLHVGACAETENVEENAKKKLKDKNFNIIMSNNVTQEGAGFDVNTNIAVVYTDEGDKVPYPLMSKAELADNIVELCIKYMEEKE